MSTAERVPASKMLNAYLKREITPRLAELGFKAQGRVHRRIKDEVVQVVDIQNWKYNDPKRARFTVEVGVCHPVILRCLASHPRFSYYAQNLEKPTITECSLRQRLGFFLDSPEDRWWTVSAVTDYLPPPAEILHPLLTRAIPWLERHSLIREFVDRIDTSRSVFDVVGLAALGDTGRALDLLVEMSAQRASQGAAVEEWQKDLTSIVTTQQKAERV